MLRVIRALELPADEDFLPNTIYLTPEYSNDGSLDHRLVITVTGTNAQVFRSSLESWEIADMIADSVININKGPNGNDGLDAVKLAIVTHDSRLSNKDQQISDINNLIHGELGLEYAHTRIDTVEDDLAAAVIAAGGNSTTYTDTKHAEALTGIAAVQAELDVTQAGVGLNAAGQFTARGVYDATQNTTGAHYIGTATTLVGTVNTLDSTLKTHRDQSLASIASLNDAITASGQAASSALGALDTRVTTAEADIGALETGLAATNTAAGTLTGRVTTAEADINALEAASAATNTAAGALATRVTTAEADIGALETGLVATNSTVTANAAAATAYTNTKHTEALAYADSAVATAVGSLDLSNAAVYAADIAARDALALTKSSFVMVADAAGDATVAAGAALYFYNLATTTYVKVAEYESMDLFPNQAVLQDISDVGGQLYYKGAAVATVHNTVNEW